MPRLLTALVVAALLTGCAHRQTSALSKPIIRRIAIIPASNPTWYSFENKAPPLGGILFLADKLDSHSKAKAFNKALLVQPATLGTDLTEEVAAALRADGFTVDILEGIKRPADDPDNVDYDGISSDADAILHLTLSEVGMYASPFSRHYVPRVNASGKLFVKGRDENVYWEDIYYGVDAKKGKSWAIVPDPKFAYSSFDEVMANIEEIRNSFDVGTLEISKRMSEQISHSPDYLKADLRAQSH